MCSANWRRSVAGQMRNLKKNDLIHPEQRKMYRFLVVLTIASSLGLESWLTLFNNFAVDMKRLSLSCLSKRAGRKTARFTVQTEPAVGQFGKIPSRGPFSGHEPGENQIENSGSVV
jgi:hypothetical protein